ncbi:MAG: alpha/beta hydrolase, partial [Bdellovibrionales bacterium]|nr:alpha/beta hydrolase [Bdellovibrionales bacterium]
VDFLKEKLIDKNPSHPIHLIAVSLGGMVALEWMRQYPMSIHASVLINTSLSGVSPFYQRLRWENYPRFFSTVMLQDAEQREKSLLNILSNRRDQHEHIALEWAQVNEQRPVKGRNVLQQLIAASHFKIEESVPVPTLLMVGLGDRLVNPQCSEDIHNKFDYPLVKHPWGGHDLTVDDAPWVVAEIKKWLATL